MKFSVSSIISLVLHATVFAALGQSAVTQTALFGVQEGAIPVEIHMVAGPKTSQDEIFEDDINETSFKRKKKKPVKIEETKISQEDGKGTSTQTLQASDGGASTDAKPNYLKNPAPAYPIRARNQGQQGLVELEVEINSDGSVKNLRLKKSSGYFMLDDAALSAVKQWEFLPANRGGVFVDSRVAVPVRFRLADGHPEISLKN
jgi:protein TonB